MSVTCVCSQSRVETEMNNIKCLTNEEVHSNMWRSIMDNIMNVLRCCHFALCLERTTTSAGIGTTKFGLDPKYALNSVRLPRSFSHVHT